MKVFFLVQERQRNYLKYVPLPLFLNFRVGGLNYKYSEIKYLKSSYKYYYWCKLTKTKANVNQFGARINQESRRMTSHTE